jgi:hypothetical protein
MSNNILSTRYKKQRERNRNNYSPCMVCQKLIKTKYAYAMHHECNKYPHYELTDRYES